MSFKHACFISYRNGDRNDTGLDARRQDIADTMNAFARDLRDELKRALITSINLLPCLVFLDQDVECLSKGDPLMATLSASICESVCMVVVFTGHYLDEEKLICAAELEGMLRRLKERCQKLEVSENRASEWVFTAVFREPEQVPQILNENLRFDFTAYDSSSKPLRDHPGYLDNIRGLALKIKDAWNEMKHHDALNFTDDCPNFNILDPDQNEQDLLQFVKTNKKPYSPKFVRS